MLIVDQMVTVEKLSVAGSKTPTWSALNGAKMIYHKRPTRKHTVRDAALAHIATGHQAPAHSTSHKGVGGLTNPLLANAPFQYLLAIHVWRLMSTDEMVLLALPMAAGSCMSRQRGFGVRAQDRVGTPHAAHGSKIPTKL